MSNPNPFASPQAAPGVGGGPGMDGSLSPRAATILSKTRGWVMLYAILLYIAAAGLLLGLAAADILLREFPQLNVLGGLVRVVILIALAYVLTEAILLTVFTAKIGGYLRSHNPAEMAAGLKSMKIFWIFEGVRLLITVVAVIGLIVLVIVGAGM